jgi:hypothetical protein
MFSRNWGGARRMQVFDVVCQHCRSIYRVAISNSVEGSAGQFECQVCTNVVDRWAEPKLRVYRMILPVGERDLQVPSGAKFFFAAIRASADGDTNVDTTSAPL